MKKWNVLRLSLTLLIFIAFYVLVISKLFFWQVIESSALQEIGKQQSTESLLVSATRGEILTSDNYPLVSNKHTYLLFTNPKVIKDKKEYAAQVAKILNIDEASVSAQLSKDLFWVRLADGIEEKEKAEIEKLALAGIGFQESSKRFYPEASMSAQLLGFVGKDEKGMDKGYFGIEGFYNEQLKGRTGRLSAVRDALGNPILNDVREEKKIDGRTLNLTLDRTVQYIAEKRLKEGIEKYQADGASAVIMEVSTGKILGMATFPRFDPEKYYEYPASTYKNAIISDLYEPGSTFKVLVMAAALDTEAVKPDTKCDTCGGPITIGEYSIKTWNNKFFPNSTMTDAIIHSDNTGMVFAVKRLGLEKLITYLKKFGIGELTHIDLQGEATFDLRDKDAWYPIDVATASFGQGISVTPLQLVAGVNAIANGGNYMKPYVVSKVITDEKKTVTIKPEVVRRVISEKTAKIVTWMMVQAVEQGEAKWVKMADYKVAGKTGTAQIPVAGHYDPDKTVASFVGFFPAEKPRFSMLVLYNKPKTSIYGSETAAPTFFSIARDIVNYYNIRPTN